MGDSVTEKDLIHLKQMAGIGQLTTGITHDLKNQLAVMGANISLLELKNLDESSAKYVENIRRQLSYTNDMFNLILKMGKGRGEFETFDLALLMEDINAFFNHFASGTCQFKIETDQNKHFIKGNPSLICNIILNLCSNAKDAVGENGLIEVKLEKKEVKKIKNDILGHDLTGPCSILTIKDNGTGIAPEMMDLIFQPFFTTKTWSKTNLGMGLANVLETARDHGASLTVDSKLGIGTTFSLYFKAIA